MATIYKYPLKNEVLQTIKMPKGAQILHVDLQRDDICLWALVDTTAEMEPRIIECFGTGFHIDNFPRKHIATVKDGYFVWHYFERVQ